MMLGIEESPTRPSLQLALPGDPFGRAPRSERPAIPDPQRTSPPNVAHAVAKLAATMNPATQGNDRDPCCASDNYPPIGWVSRQLVKRRLGVLQDPRVEAFGEPAIGRREQITGSGALAVVTPEAGESGGRAQLKSFRILPLCNNERLVVALLGRRPIAGNIKQLASRPM